jgi:hypothetical protein
MLTEVPLAHFRITHGKPFEIASRFHTLRESVKADIKALVETFGAAPCREVTQGTALIGFYFGSKPSRDWLAIKGHSGYFKPNGRTLNGQDIAKKLAAIHIPQTMDLAVDLGCRPFFMGFCVDVGLVKVGEVFYLEAPKYDPPTLVDGIEPMSRGEYYIAVDGVPE